MEQVTAPDGASIRVRSNGAGPGVVVVHGGGVTLDVYGRLAQRLGETFTVHRYNRRGRADAAPRTGPYRVDEDVADLGAVLEQTGSVRVLGHSAGGLVALRAALTLPIYRLALYDAAASVDGGFPTAWLPDALAAVRAGDTPLALALTTAGINTHSAAARLPLRARVALCRAFLATSVGRTMGELLATTLEETEQVRRLDGPATAWSEISADVLLAYGASGPPYYADLNRALAGAIRHARVLPVARSGHDGLNRAPRRLLEPLVGFLAGS